MVLNASIGLAWIQTMIVLIPVGSLIGVCYGIGTVVARRLEHKQTWQERKRAYHQKARW